MKMEKAFNLISPLKRTALMGFLFLCTCLPSHAQTVLISEKTKTVIRQNHPDGKKKTVGKLKNGKKTGMWLEYGQDGWLVSKTKYKNDELRWVLIYKKGRIVESIDAKGNRKPRPHCGCN